MNRADADAAGDALRALLVKVGSRRAARLVVADHDQVLAKLAELADAAAAVVAGAESLASERFGADRALLLKLGDPFEDATIAAKRATAQLGEARNAVRREVLAHRDEPRARSSGRSPWVPAPASNVLLAPLDAAVTAMWAMANCGAAHGTNALSDQWWLSAGVARIMAALWSICTAEIGLLDQAYTGVQTTRSATTAQECVTYASREWRSAGMAFVAMLQVLRRRARQGPVVAASAPALATAGGGA